jgi:glutathione S-transferase
MELTLVSHHLCPYVQRAAIALAEKQIPFERIWIDLSNKPDWFKKISPLGKVPVLSVKQADGQETSIFESAVILEYLEETTTSPLHPVDPLERARHRGWIEFGSAVLNASIRRRTRRCSRRNGPGSPRCSTRLRRRYRTGRSSQASASALSMRCLRRCFVTSTPSTGWA